MSYRIASSLEAREADFNDLSNLLDQIDVVLGKKEKPGP